MAIDFPRCGLPANKIVFPRATRDPTPPPPSPPNSLFDESDDDEEIPKLDLSEGSAATGSKPASISPPVEESTQETSPELKQPVPKQTTPATLKKPSRRKNGKGMPEAAAASSKPLPIQNTNTRAPVTLSSEEQKRYYLRQGSPAWAGTIPDTHNVLSKKSNAGTASARLVESIFVCSSYEAADMSPKSKSSSKASQPRRGEASRSNTPASHTSSQTPSESTSQLAPSLLSFAFVPFDSPTTSSAPVPQLHTPRKDDLNGTVTEVPSGSNDRPPSLSSKPSSSTQFLEHSPNPGAAPPPAHSTSGKATSGGSPSISNQTLFPLVETETLSPVPVYSTNGAFPPYIPVCSVPSNYVPPPPPPLSLPPPPTFQDLSPAQLSQIAQSLSAGAYQARPAPLDFVSPSWLSMPLTPPAAVAGTSQRPFLSPGPPFLHAQVAPPLRRTISEQTVQTHQPTVYPQQVRPAYTQIPRVRTPTNLGIPTSQKQFTFSHPPSQATPPMLATQVPRPVSRSASTHSPPQPHTVPTQSHAANSANQRNRFSAAMWTANSPVLYAAPPLPSPPSSHGSSVLPVPHTVNSGSYQPPNAPAISSTLSQSHIVSPPAPAPSHKRQVEEVSDDDEIQEIPPAHYAKRFRTQ